MPVVFDASVLLALVFDEPGSERARRSLSAGVISAVNLSEAIATLSARGATADDIDALIDDLPLDVEPITLADARAAGMLRVHTKALGLSLGDRACLALGQRLDAMVLTADRAWAKLPDALRGAVELVR